MPQGSQWLALALLIAALILSAFKLRLPLGRGNSTMSMAYVVDFLVIVTAGPVWVGRQWKVSAGRRSGARSIRCLPAGEGRH